MAPALEDTGLDTDDVGVGGDVRTDAARELVWRWCLRYNITRANFFFLLLFHRFTSSSPRSSCLGGGSSLQRDASHLASHHTHFTHPPHPLTLSLSLSLSLSLFTFPTPYYLQTFTQVPTLRTILRRCPSRAHGVRTKVLDARDLGRRAPVLLRRVERRGGRSGGRPFLWQRSLAHPPHRGRGAEVVRPAVTGPAGVAQHRLGRGTPPPLGRVCG